MAQGKPRKALVWFESLIGSGHAAVASKLVQELREKKYEVVVCSGSTQYLKQFDFGDGVTIEPLERIHRDNSREGSGEYYTEVDGIRTPAREDTATLEQRKKRLEEIFHAHKPDVVITELWPAEHQLFDGELENFLTVAKSNGAMFFSIVRDIMRFLGGTGIGGKDAEGFARLANGTDGLIVRGDERVVKLEESFPEINGVDPKKVHYAGVYFSPLPEKTKQNDADKGVLVALGGSYMSENLDFYKDIIRSRKISALNNRKWKIVAGNGCPDDAIADLKAMAKEEAGNENDIEIVAALGQQQYLQDMVDAALLVTQGGYNGMYEAAVAGTKTACIPIRLKSDGAEQNEAEFRADLMQKLGYCQYMLRAEANSPEKLAALFDHAYCADVCATTKDLKPLPKFSTKGA